MKISELIRQLADVLVVEGDIEIRAYRYDGVGAKPVEAIEVQRYDDNTLVAVVETWSPIRALDAKIREVDPSL